VALALLARNHGVLVCKSFDRLEEIVEHLTELAATDSNFSSRVTETSARMGTLRTKVSQTSAAVPAPDDTTVAQLWEQARREAG
jgi:hypothetical protein